MTKATLDHVFDGYAHRLDARGKVRLDSVGELISGSFRVLASNNSGLPGIIVGNGEMPEQFWTVPANQCSELVPATTLDAEDADG